VYSPSNVHPPTHHTAIVGFGLVLARFFSPTNTIGSVVAALTTATSGLLLTMATQRYFHIVWMLDNKKFDADHLTPIIVTILMGSLLTLLLLGGFHSKLVECGCVKANKDKRHFENQHNNSDPLNNSNTSLSSSSSIQSIQSRSTRSDLRTFNA